MLNQEDSGWIIDLNPKKNHNISLNIFCFHYAGSCASMFKEWCNLFPNNIKLYAIQLPGREYRFDEKLISDMSVIVSSVLEELVVLLDRPYALLGHSMGALICYELCQSLKEKGFTPPLALLLSGRDSPKYKWKSPDFSLMTDDELVEAVREYDGTPDFFLDNDSLRELWLPRFRADLTACVKYEHARLNKLDVPIFIMNGVDDQLTTETGLLDWSNYTKGKVKINYYKGDHFFVHNQVEKLSSDIIKYIFPILNNEVNMSI
ncbi:thioesterase domain-containing protein [Vibrio mediterranei]|uniref:thioesterase II family protein n=1 Tax=Vibrio mediterranei TaxID=689 RepID=UPI001EFDE01D|nr:alpha/beta fold hydrolase [Vibrio mediterranei]MCG9629021.1 thioesterase domain-containing protein [Vibrio mediterranei]